MKKITLPLIVIILLISACGTDPGIQPQSPAAPVYTEKDIYFYSFKTIEGDVRKLSDYKGKKIMFVNTASLCSNTPQYEKLEALYRQYSSKLVIIGFPCNQFGLQEPDDEEAIKNFCTSNYQVTFPLSKKINVNDPDQYPIYKWLTKKELNGNSDSYVDWNFQKYLVDEKGNFIKMFEHHTQPDDPAIIAAIEQ